MKLTKAQKAANARTYKAIRKAYNKVKGQSNITYVQFKHRVQARAKSEKLSYKEASNRESYFIEYKTSGERRKHGFTEAIKEKFKGDYNELRMLSRNKKGQFVGIRNNMAWDKDMNGYVLGGKYFIDVSNSPEEIVIYAI